MKDLQNSPSFLIQGGSTHRCDDMRLSCRVQGFDTTALECVDPLLDTRQRSLHFLCNVLWTEVRVFQHGDRFLPGACQRL
jgi:hypothetical protein